MLIDEIFVHYFSQKKESTLFFVGAFFSLIGFFLGWLLFPGKILPGVFFSTMPLVPMSIKIFSQDLSKKDIFEIYMYIFFGMIVELTILYSFFPVESIVPLGTYENIQFSLPTAFQNFSSIIVNNTKIIFLGLILSMLYSIGSLFIITLNSFVVAQLFSNFLTSGKSGLFIAFLPHTIVELSGYFLGAIAGTVLASAFIRFEYRSHEFNHAVLQSAIFFTFSIMAVILGAVLEAFVLPTII